MDFNIDSRGFNINEHINEHVKDIQQIFEVLKHGRKTRTPMQRLPRHMRRRAMSYNVKRMPRNWRKFAVQMTQKSKHRKKPPSRFTRRRRIFADGTDPSLLKTHRWHAKRYRMIKAFGMKLPYACYQKVKRSCIRNASYGCCVVDHSYWKIIRIKESESFNNLLLNLSRLNSLPNFEDNRIHELLLFSINMTNHKDCLGPIILKKIYECNTISYEISCHPAVLPGLIHVMESYNPTIVENKARLTFYGPESLNKIVKTLFLKQTVNPESDFGYLLEGAVIVESVMFELIGMIDDDKKIEFNLYYRNKGPDMIIDLVFDIQFEKSVFYKFVHNECRVLGLSDEYNVRCSYGMLNFPEDSMDFIDTSFIQAEVDDMMKKHYKRPRNRRVNYDKLSKDDPFAFNFDDIGKTNDKLVTIKIMPVKKGAPERFGFIYSEVEDDSNNKEEDEVVMMDVDEEVLPKKSNTLGEFVELDMFKNSRFKKIVPMSRLFDIVDKPKLSKRQKKKIKETKKEKEMVEDVKGLYLIPQGNMIGRIVRGLKWTNRHGSYYAFAYCPLKMIDDLKEKNQNWVYFRNINSKVYRKANFTIVDSNDRYF